MEESNQPKFIEERAFSDFFECSPDGFLIVQNNHILKVNNQCSQLFNYEPHELNGLPISTLFPHWMERVKSGPRPSSGTCHRLQGTTKSLKSIHVELCVSHSPNDSSLTFATVKDDTVRSKLGKPGLQQAYINIGTAVIQESQELAPSQN